MLSPAGMACTNCIRNALLSTRTFSPVVTQVRWSRYSSLYLEPTLDLEELKKPLSDDDLRKYQPIKAATNEQSSSLNHDETLQKFIRMLTMEGNKQRARKILDKTFANVKLIQLEAYHKAKTEEDKEAIELNPNSIFHDAVENCKPLLITQGVRRGGVLYQVPIPVPPRYQIFKAMKWIIESATDKDDQIRIWDKLARELISASKNEGKSVHKKQELHKLCEANRAYAHYRW